MDGSMVIDGVDLNYLGVYSIWNGNLGKESGTLSFTPAF
jgi:hypothetical protein